ncbi:MAG TPA: hypothetical protein VMT35_19025 [Ignavibacteriaceae bacterium]|nr:hypothetical protein [Ignavibacteriaceae bacterium]
MKFPWPLRKVIYLIPLVLLTGCTNPFSPSFDESDENSSVISDLKTPEGVFQNMQYAYTFRDTLIYSDLIAPDFIFTFHDYDRGFDDSWGRDEEMRTTYRLFQSSQRLDLIWNNISASSADSSNATIIRAFNLTVTLNSSDLPLQAYGKVNMSLKKNLQTGKWQISRWVDESNSL